MTTKVKLAVFMDYEKARLITCENGNAAFAETFESGKETHPRVEGEGSDHSRFGSDPYQGSNNEYSKNRQEERLKHDYFKQIKEKLTSYPEILLIGAGQAKKEMYNYLLDNAAFKAKAIHIQNCDYKTDNQLLELVRNYFA